MQINSPETRQADLVERLQYGEPLATRDLEREYQVSTATLRRDLIALESRGLLKRIKGGVMPVTAPATLLRQRPVADVAWVAQQRAAVHQLVADTTCLFFDGGRTAAAIARLLPANYRGTVITPSPHVAADTLAHNIDTIVLGGHLSAFGGIVVGTDAERAVDDTTADIAILGACGLDANFGLSADDLQEASMKRRMAINARYVLVAAGREKLRHRARHRVLKTSEINALWSDADGSDNLLTELRDLGVDVKAI